jgi:hypothetical protein
MKVKLNIAVEAGPTLVVDGEVACYPIPESEEQRERRWRNTIGQIVLEKAGLLAPLRLD